MKPTVKQLKTIRNLLGYTESNIDGKKSKSDLEYFLAICTYEFLINKEDELTRDVYVNRSYRKTVIVNKDEFFEDVLSIMSISEFFDYIKPIVKTTYIESAYEAFVIYCESTNK